MRRCGACYCSNCAGYSQDCALVCDSCACLEHASYLICDAGYFPFTSREWKSLPFWVNAWQLWGSIGFLISAAVPYKTDITWKGQILEVIFGNLIGSVWFGLYGYGLFLELSNPQMT